MSSPFSLFKEQWSHNSFSRHSVPNTDFFEYREFLRCRYGFSALYSQLLWLLMYPLKCSHAASVKANSQSHNALWKTRVGYYKISGQLVGNRTEANGKFVLKGSANVVSVHYNRGAASYACACSGIYRRWVASYTAHSAKVEVKVKFTLEQATKAQRESRDIALLFP